MIRTLKGFLRFIDRERQIRLKCAELRKMVGEHKAKRLIWNRNVVDRKVTLQLLIDAVDYAKCNPKVER